jgi:hypothetical protein
MVTAVRSTPTTKKPNKELAALKTNFPDCSSNCVNPHATHRIPFHMSISLLDTFPGIGTTWLDRRHLDPRHLYRRHQDRGLNSVSELDIVVTVASVPFIQTAKRKIKNQLTGASNGARKEER